MRKKRRVEELQHGLMCDILNLIENYGLDGNQSLIALAGAASRVICIDAPDISTAQSWHIEFCGTIHMAVNQAAEDGDAAWSRIRCH